MTISEQPGRPLAQAQRVVKSVPNNGITILDIAQHRLEHSIVDDMLEKLRPKDGGMKRMPTLLLYDEAGLNLFEEITYLDEYYLTNDEIEVLEASATRIAERIPTGSMVVELGSGNLRKVTILLQALDRLGRDVEYYALDISVSELERTLSAIPAGRYKHVKCYGLHGTYEDGLDWLKRPENMRRPKCIMSMGSSIGNFDRDEAAEFLSRVAQVLNKGDCLLVGLDACKDKDKVFHAYNDRHGVTHKFVLNGLTRANQILGKNVFNLQDWKVLGEYDEVAGRHQASYVPLRDVSFDDIHFKAGEAVRVEESYKYSATESAQLWEAAGLIEGAKWGTRNGEYNIHMLSKPAALFPSHPNEYAQAAVPSIKEWEDLWSSWDIVTRSMIPEEELLSKPIKLRNACIFYLGHIPTFLDIHLTRATGGVPTEPSYYSQIFERGIDPDVDNPELCHAHSEIPDEWPPTPEILAFQGNVRNRVRECYHDGPAFSEPRLMRALWLAFEHEAMHLETLLYMLIQSEKTLPPPGTIAPDFEALATQAKSVAVTNDWVKIPASEITVGIEDPEEDHTFDRYFGWDNEKPPRQVEVKAFLAKARPVTNGEYGYYLEQVHESQLPVSWIERPKETSNGEYRNGSSKSENGHSNGSTAQPSPRFLKGKSAKTIYGPIPLEYALDWPVTASYDELAGYAKWMDARIPTMEEARSIYRYVDDLKKKDVEKVLAKTISAVNGHLSNDGVEETPPSKPELQGSSRTQHVLDPLSNFINLQDCNVGLKHWHPLPVTPHGNKLAGQSDMGGVWEWTSSVLESYEGFKPMDLYPGYTADFFDTKHNIVLGGSWATHPRLAGRKSFVNWYQRNYPYVWAGVRLVRDI